MNATQILCLILFIILTLFIIYKIIKYNLKNKTETITCFTGGLGAGKSLMTIEYSLRKYKKILKKWTFKYKCLKFINKFRKHKKSICEKPLLYSNIPILLNRKKKIYSNLLTNDILLLQKSIPLNSVVVIDEIGSYATQFDYNKDAIAVSFDEFIRFFRHYTKGGYLFVNDQCSENIVLDVRRRINSIHNLSNCFVLFKKFAFYFDRIINISEEIKTIDVKQNEQESFTQDNKDLKFVILRYSKNYDTYCYSERYKNVPRNNDIKHTALKTNNLLKCDFKNNDYKVPKTDTLNNRKEYKK